METLRERWEGALPDWQAGAWLDRLLDLELRAVDEDKDEVEYTCVAKELARLLEASTTKYEVLALAQEPDRFRFHQLRGQTHLTLVARPRLRGMNEARDPVVTDSARERMGWRKGQQGDPATRSQLESLPDGTDWHVIRTNRNRLCANRLGKQFPEYEFSRHHVGDGVYQVLARRRAGASEAATVG